MGNMSKVYAEGTALYPQFRSVTDEILWLQPDADLGYSMIQHRIGLLYLQSSSDIENLYQGYKWLFISLALGNETARDDLIELNTRMDHDQIDAAYELAQDWFEQKFDDNSQRDESKWALELLKWRFALSLVN